MNVGIIHSK